ncbi:MAG: anthranilate synthase component I [Candidatus Bathyarchaeota archaeon]|nr:anthranilate synthase component I [Candidatus Bathyarchaeota archaeon]
MAFGSTPTPTKPLNYLKFNYTNQPLTLFSKLHQKYPTAYLLESIEGPKKLAQYSFIGFDPKTTITAKNGNLTITDTQTGKTTTQQTSDPLQTIQQHMAPYANDMVDFRFVGGALGYISYDAIRYIEKVPSHKPDVLGFPDVDMGIFEDGVVFDHTINQAYYYFRGENRLKALEALLSEAPAGEEDFSFTAPSVNVGKADFEAAVAKAKKYIVEGDIFQVVPSKRFQFSFSGSLLSFYRSLRQINPSPYMFFYKSGSRQIVGASPEMLIRVDKRKVMTFPIAGTVPYTADPAENRRLGEELLMDEKERAEHVMLVDLARNDIGRISKNGSVSVPEFMQVHQFSHVQHIVSQVVGDLKDGLESFDALKAVFPAGTVSGAPKVRAMEIIEELEPSHRGPYAGAVGYFSCNGNADFAITIRTLFAEGNTAYIQAGAGIVADSVPEKEWVETEHKAEALMKALQHASGGKIQ